MDRDTDLDQGKKGDAGANVGVDIDCERHRVALAAVYTVGVSRMPPWNAWAGVTVVDLWTSVGVYDDTGEVMEQNLCPTSLRWRPTTSP